MKKLSFILAMAFMLCGCAPDYSQYYKLTPEYLQIRQVQTRIYDTNDSNQLITASAHVLQDLGYVVDNSDFDLGLLTCYKDRDATQAGQVVARILVGLLTGADMGNDVAQRIKVTMVVTPVKGSKERHVVRTSFVRAITNSHKITRYELILEPAIYQSFYDKLSQSIFLTAHEL